ncbi:hypothetical protein MHH28_12625 [Paenibacillus sp. FSL K6-1217]|uniref:hypothetical protein n=1 Tax=Paenibacillus sp. FSL K6-1217 TaxID=2921466 RepID=UPI00324D4870
MQMSRQSVPMYAAAENKQESDPEADDKYSCDDNPLLSLYCDDVVADYLGDAQTDYCGPQNEYSGIQND